MPGAASCWFSGLHQPPLVTLILRASLQYHFRWTVTLTRGCHYQESTTQWTLAITNRLFRVHKANLIGLSLGLFSRILKHLLLLLRPFYILLRKVYEEVPKWRQTQLLLSSYSINWKRPADAYLLALASVVFLVCDTIWASTSQRQSRPWERGCPQVIAILISMA